MANVKLLRKFTAAPHRHRACVLRALGYAEQVCREHGQRLTPIRRRVLELVWGSHAPVKAYDLLSRLQGDHKTAAPPTVYRALEFLQGEGLVHRIECLNAYVGCGEPGHQGGGQFLICRHCGEVAEMDDPDITGLLRRKAGALAFQVENKTVEIIGVCRTCSVR